MKIQCQHFYYDSKNCVVSIVKENITKKCDKMTDVNARKEILKNSSCYYSCLKTGNISKKCTKIKFVKFSARNATLVFVKKRINNHLIKLQIQRLI